MAANATKLAKDAAEHGLVLDKGPGGYRLTNAETGTLVAADWTAPDGYGLKLAEVEKVLAGM